jgi:hypothetical protein
MKKLITAAASSLLVMVFAFSPMAIAADAEQAFSKCKSEAEADEVSDADVKTYVTNCMKDLGVDGSEISSLVDEEYSSTEQETAKSQVSE